jgi:hypothetical protein
MRSRMMWLACALALGAGSFAAFSLTKAQNPSSPSPPAPPTARLGSPARDLSKLTVLGQQMFLSAQRAGDWLRRANRPDGRFVCGYVPALKTPLEGDYYLRQAGAAFALARVARFLGDEHYAVLARQAILTLLLDTSQDSADPQARHTTLPSVVVNRVAAAGLLVASIHELPSPGDDLLDQGEQLCAFLRKKQNENGSLDLADGPSEEIEPNGVNSYPGMALYGLVRSQKLRPAPWKADLVRKALPYYATWWQSHQTMAFVPWQTMAFAEACALTKEKAFADFSCRMNDWLCDLQYAQLDPRHPLWMGGFMEWADGKPNPAAPHADSAAYAESLAEACRVAHQTSDTQRFQRYREALERSLQFLNTLQYTDANTQHFADWYRPVLVGAFYTSHQNGDIRIDYTQHAVSALVQYLRYSGDW